MTVHAGDSPERLLAARPPLPRNRAGAGSRLLASIVDSSDDAIIGKTLDGVITTWNSSAERIYGYRAEEIIGRSVSLLIPPGLPNEMNEILDRIRVGERVDHYETRRRRKDGATIAVSLTVSPIHDASGTVVGASAIARDITDRHRIRDQVRLASQYARSLIEASRDPLVTIGLEGKITEVNEATIDMTGVARGDLAGTDFSDCFTEPDLAREGYFQVLAQGFVTDYPLTIRHTGGKLTEVLYNASVYKDAAGRVLGVFATARDVTDWKRAESEVAKQRARELDRLAELERFQKLTVGRELRMIELKKEIEDLRAAAGST
jgi:PAS domain S-box-containing protein